MDMFDVLVAQSRQHEHARAAHHPNRFMAHEVRIAARTGSEPTYNTTRARARPLPARWNDVLDGAGAVLPAVLAFAPLALMVGAAISASDNRLAALLSTWTIHGGAAQLVTLDVLAEGSGWIAAAMAGLLIQIRLSAYSTSMVRDWRTAPLGLRVLAGLLLSDAPWALAQSRSTGRRSFYLGAGLALFLAWPAMVTLGTAAGDVVGGIAAAALVPALVLGRTVVTQLRERPLLVAAGAAGLSAGVLALAPAGMVLVGAAVVGMVAGVVADRVRVRTDEGAVS